MYCGLLTVDRGLWISLQIYKFTDLPAAALT
jgi:hypothetical protein